MRIYLAGPLFTQGQRMWNRTLAAALEERIAGAGVTLPQDFQFDGAFNRSSDFPRIFRGCLDALKEADLVVAVLDGPDVDSGTAFEVGYARATGIPVIGVRTDYRESQDRGLNLMLSQGCTELLREMSFAEDVTMLARDLAGKIVAAARRIERTGRTR